MASAWGLKATGGGENWADQIEQEEAQNGGPLPAKEFPTLGEAAKVPGKPKEKKAKAVPVSLKDFLNLPGPSGKLERDILMNLPTGPRPREEGAAATGLGGGFKDYGGDRERGGFRRGGDREDRPPREEFTPSRADEDGDWGATNKFQSSDSSRRDRGGFGDRDRSGGFGDRDRGDSAREPRAASAADQTDDWGREKKYEPSQRGQEFERRTFSNRDAPREGEGRPDFHSRADEQDQWTRGKDASGEADGGSYSKGRGFTSERAPGGDSRWNRGEGSSGASAPSDRPTERPRLVLAPRTKPLDTPADASAEAPAAAATEAAPAQNGDAPVVQKKSNPFGAARPREEVLKEKGIDYVKEELKLEHAEVIRDETPEEKELKKEIADLNLRLETLMAAGEESEQLEEGKVELDEKERQLYRLQAELDDKVKYSRAKAAEAEGPGRGREKGGDWDRPREQTGPSPRGPPPSGGGGGRGGAAW